MASYFLRKEHLEKLKSINFCVYCGSKNSLVIDHIYPRSKGGSNDITNLTRSCTKCNLYKSDFIIEEFLARIRIKREKSERVINSCVYIIDKHKRRATEIFGYQNVFEKLKIERANHSYYSSIIGNIIKEKYKLF